MDLAVRYPRFLSVFGAPTDALCCGTMTLRTGVYLVAGFDAAVGVLSAGEMAYELWTRENPAIAYVVAQDLLAIAALPFAVMALLGIISPASEKVQKYSSFKLFELTCLAFLSILALPATCSRDSLVCDFYSLTLAYTIRIGFNFYCAYLVWSTAVRMSLNELVVVLYGPEVAKIVKDQSPS